ncbi:hypothetical protein QYF61_020468 [Mycteria americana]|uniref:Uncharacterized protein n=1 Tax=Mycteria americana TaxID=33587 RepID=A0AAN7RJI3_MYCAM|nr:hypothetical protein QYF61_020468 [Mycteria americana]
MGFGASVEKMRGLGFFSLDTFYQFQFREEVIEAFSKALVVLGKAEHVPAVIHTIQCYLVAKMATSVLECLKRTLAKGVREVIVSLCSSLLRPPVHYWVHFCTPSSSVLGLAGKGCTAAGVETWLAKECPEEKSLATGTMPYEPLGLTFQKETGERPQDVCQDGVRGLKHKQ